ncbi:MAG: sigma-54-dependent Fis family transcriptional regulator [Deltaproteobacteria bacterium]|nr:sigma-54-dependent Fis family transcriptional regulator [Deltaproteobacteria bacterium]
MTQPNVTSLPVLLVDDEPQILKSFSIMLKSSGIKDVLTCGDSREVFAILESREIAAVVMDLSMPHVPGGELLSRISQSYPHVPVIIMTARNELETAVGCMQTGAFDYLVKPVEISRFEASVKRALEVRALKSEVSSLKRYLLDGRLDNEGSFSEIITVSKAMRAIFQYLEAVAETSQPILITGETGVGKELFARAAHKISARPGEFVAVNVAGLDDTMFSDTLFGHKKGAYTGADAVRDGLIARATGGTLFLDEIGDTSETSQIKLLRLLQEQKYYPLGSDVAKNSDVRVVVATNQDLSGLISGGKFRKDLYYRLRAHQIHIPPLRERPEDIPVLLNHFIARAAAAMKKKKPFAPPELVMLLSLYHFPGNVRELEGMVVDAVARHKSGILSLDSFKNVIGRERAAGFSHAAGDYAVGEGQAPYPSYSLPKGGIPPNPGANGAPIPTLKEAEGQLVSKAMQMSNNNQGIAASLLGISRQALNKRLNKTAPPKPSKKL